MLDPLTAGAGDGRARTIAVLGDKVSRVVHGGPYLRVGGSGGAMHGVLSLYFAADAALALFGGEAGHAAAGTISKPLR